MTMGAFSSGLQFIFRPQLERRKIEWNKDDWGPMCLVTNCLPYHGEIQGSTLITYTTNPNTSTSHYIGKVPMHLGRYEDKIWNTLDSKSIVSLCYKLMQNESIHIWKVM